MKSNEAGSKSLLARWAAFTVRHRLAVLASAALLLVVTAGIWRIDHGEFVNNFEIPGAESQQATDLLRERFPNRSGDSATIVIKAEQGLERPEVRQEVLQIVAEAERIPSVVGVVPPYVPDNPTISADGAMGYVVVMFEQQADAVPAGSIDALYDLRDAHNRSGFQVELGGQVITAAEKTPPGTSEILGIGAAIIILLIAFGSVVAMGLPLITALSGLAGSLFLIGLLALKIDFNTETRAFTAMIGIGVGIDYALFIVTRFREGLHHGLTVEEAVVQAIDTAGRSILFAGSIVVVALLGLMTMGIPFVGAIGFAAAIVVTLAVIVALTVLPALLALIGRSIDRWSIPFFHASGASNEQGFWYRLAKVSQRHPWPIMLGGLALLLVLSAPVFDMRLGSADAGNNPTSLTSRQSYDLITEGFGPGFNGPLMIVLDVEEATDSAAAERVTEQLREQPGVARVAEPVFNPAGDTGIVMVIPTTSPQDEETQDLVHRLRREVLPEALDGSGAVAYLGGPTAAFIDIGERISERLPLFFMVVIGLSMILLMVVFRSLIVPLVAAIMNMLSISAAYGLLVAVFQWGWLSELFGVDRTGPIESFLPMMLFAVLFGLSTDYHIFLMSRIHESWLRTGDNLQAVREGSATTSRVITAAASIMVVVFLSFTLSDARIVKEFGLGLAAAVFVDATVIRIMLVPAITSLLGDWNWYLPDWLQRRVPHVALEAASPAPEGALGMVAEHD